MLRLGDLEGLSEALRLGDKDAEGLTEGLKDALKLELKLADFDGL